MLIHGPRGACVTRKDPETMRALCDFSEKPRGMYHCYCPKFQARKVRLGGTEPLALGASSEIQASPGKVPTAVRSQEKPISSHTPLWRACVGSWTLPCPHPMLEVSPRSGHLAGGTAHSSLGPALASDHTCHGPCRVHPAP